MSTSYKITGTIREVGQPKAINDKLTKRNLVLDVEDGKYPQVFAVEFMGDKCALLDEYRAGETVEVEANLRGREWRSPSGEVKYFTSLAGWKLSRIGAAKPASSGGYDPGAPPQDDIGW